MSINFETWRKIVMLVSEEKDVVIFPVSRSEDVFEHNPEQHKYYVAYFPIELKYPYTAEELAEKIKFGFEEWDKHECYPNFSGRNTFEEKYYGIKGFKNAVKGKRYLSICYSKDFKHEISISFPTKRGYAYLGVDKMELPKNIDWIDYASAAIELINRDAEQLKSFKIYKSKLNI